MIDVKTSAASPNTKEGLFTRLYQEAFPAVARYIAKKGGTLDDAREVFQEALVSYYEKVLIGGFQPHSSDEAYLFGVCRHLWLKAFKENRRLQSTDGVDFSEEREPVATPKKLLQFLETAGKKCMELLQAFYYEKLSMSKMSDRFGFSSQRSATVQKYKCLEKVRNEVQSKSLSYEDFTD